MTAARPKRVSSKILILVVAAAAVLGIGTVSAVVASSATTQKRGVARAHARGARAASRSCAAKPSAPLDSLGFSEEGDGPSRLVVVHVCIDGHGPYRFLVSTGSGTSIVSPRLASTLKLRRARGAKAALYGVTCVASAPEATVRSWSVDGIRLDPQPLAIADVPSQGLRDAFSGALGSDVLSRFGSVSINYRTKKLLIAQQEGPAPKGARLVLGDSTTTPPAGLSGAPPKVSSVLRVVGNGDSTVIALPVTMDHHVEQFAVDSGALDSSLVPSAAKDLKLRSLGRSASVAGAGCKGTAKLFSSDAWSIGGKLLPARAVQSRRLAGSVNDSLDGVLGSNVLASQGTLVIDYRTAHLWLVP